VGEWMCANGTLPFHRISFGSWIITIWNSAATHFYYKVLINVFIFNINIFDAVNSFHLKKYTNIHITLAAFGQTLLALKIYSTLRAL